MNRSVTARYAIHPAARFVRANGHARERRLGLRSFGTFRPASARPTVLRHTEPSPLVALRSRSRSAVPARPVRAHSGGPRPVVSIHWADARRFGADRRATATPAPWRG
jgi:hypothetical protein